MSRVVARPPVHRLRVSWPLVLLLVSISLTAATAFQAQRTLRSHRQTAVRLLKDYGAFAAWTYSRHANEELADIGQRIIGPILHREPHHAPRIPSARSLAGYYEESFEDEEGNGSPRHRKERAPSIYFAFELGADTIQIFGDTMSAAEQERLRSTVTGTAYERLSGNNRLGALMIEQDGETRFVVYGLMRTETNPVVYGFELRPSQYEALFEDAFTKKQILPAALTRGRDNRELLAVRVRGPEDRPIYESRDFPTWAWPAEESIVLPGFRFQVRATVRPEFADQLIIGGLPRSRLPLILAMLVLSAGLALVAVAQLKREGELARLRGDFVSSVSHELRTPLAQIRLFLETLRLGRFTTEEQREWSLSSIDRETNRLAHLVENVLHFARSGHAPLPTVPAAPTDIVSEVEHIVRSFGALAASRRATLRIEGERELVVRLERESFRQVLLNLLDNAVKYGPHGQTVTISVTRSAFGARVAVTDEGPGVPSNERDAIWKPFFRGSESAVRAVGGSGIGLSIVRDIVTRHGGRVSLESAEGRGATFVVEIPALEPLELAATTSAASLLGSTS